MQSLSTDPSVRHQHYLSPFASLNPVPSWPSELTFFFIIARKARESDDTRGMTKSQIPLLAQILFWSILVNQGGSDILGMQGDFKPTS